GGGGGNGGDHVTNRRVDGRGPADLRPVKAEMGYLEWAEGSCLLEMGKTRVLVSASFEPKAPRWLQGTGSGWVTAEYAMLPRATAVRTPREVKSGRPSGRPRGISARVGRPLGPVPRLGGWRAWPGGGRGRRASSGSWSSRAPRSRGCSGGMARPPELALATKNPGKIREILEICADWPVAWLTADDAQWPEVEETGATYRAN